MGKLNLTTEIDQKSGFCFGVISAIEKAEKTLDNYGNLFCLGEIVHNDEEIKRLEKKGLLTIAKEEYRVMNNKTVLFRAHGEPPESYEIALRNNLTIIDASCPIILKLQKTVKKSYDNNEHIYIFGKRKHPEIIALNGQIENKAFVFESLEELDLKKIPSEITLYSQTTQSLATFRKIVRTLKDAGIKVQVKDTICRQVSNREPNLIDFCKRFDKVIFIAGTNSSNGKVLYDICKNINKYTYYISSPEQIEKKWFKKNDKVGICGGTSTPMWLMKKAEEKLLSL
jgi:4-hydroxy-3-methylbut-2-enyl diphosphate reductase